MGSITQVRVLGGVASLSQEVEKATIGTFFWGKRLSQASTPREPQTASSMWSTIFSPSGPQIGMAFGNYTEDSLTSQFEQATRQAFCMI